MTWTVGQVVWYQGKMGTLLKVHSNEQLLAVRISQGNAKGWPWNDCLPVDQTTRDWQNLARGQKVYVGINAIPQTIIGWSMEARRIITQTPDRYEAVNADDVAITPHDAKRRAWFRQWATNEPAVTQTQLEHWKQEEDWNMLLIHWEYTASRRPLTKAENIQMAALWRKSGNPIQALRIYQVIVQKWPESEPVVLAGVGGCYRTLKQFDRAKEIYQDLQDRYPDTANQVAAALGMSGVYHDEGQAPLASEWHKKAQELDPTIAKRSAPPKLHRSQDPPMDQATINRLVANIEAHEDIPSVAALMGTTAIP